MVRLSQRRFVGVRPLAARAVGVEKPGELLGRKALPEFVEDLLVRVKDDLVPLSLQALSVQPVDPLLQPVRRAREVLVCPPRQPPPQQLPDVPSTPTLGP